MSMEQPLTEYDLIHNNMLRMIRSARSRCGMDRTNAPTGSGIEKANSAAVIASSAMQSVGMRWRAEGKTGARHSTGCTDGGEQQSIDRPGKRGGTPRGGLRVSARPRLIRSRSSLGCSENAAPEKPHQGGAPTAVLGDVTNTTAANGQGNAGFGGGGSSDMISMSKPSPPREVTHETRFSQSFTPPSPDQADAAHVDDPQHVVEYVPDIMRQMQREGELLLPCPDYMNRQVHVNAKMRSILNDWLVDVHKKYKLRSETLFLAINIIDRYLELRATAQRHLQLVGVTAMFIAAKFEEVYPPQIKDFVYVTDKAYSKDDMINMECQILTVLEFKISRPTAMHFLERYQCVNGCTDAHRDLACYLCELSLVEYKMIKYSPSHLAASAVLLSNKLLRRSPAWKPALVKQTRMTEQMLKDCAKDLCELLEGAESSSLQAVRKKYSQLKHHSVAKLNFMMGANANAPRESTSGMSSRRSSVSNSNSAPLQRCFRPSIGGNGSGGCPSGVSSTAGTSVTNLFAPSTMPMELT